jgi:hypothetical protein
MPYTETTPGVELIRKERMEQLEKHRFSIDHDKGYKYGELADLAQYAMTGDLIYYPNNMSTYYVGSIRRKERIEQLAIAGALIAAEIDRILSINDSSNEQQNESKG